MSIELYTYFRSSAAFRVRIALEYKGIAATHHAVSLLADEQRAPAYAALNPQQLVPALVAEGRVLTQSLAIIEYLDEAFPDTPPLIWGDARQRARIRSLALAVACDVHPLNNLRVLKFLQSDCGQDDAGIKRWCQHWMQLGFEAIESMLHEDTAFCAGDAVSLADVTLVPQVFNARRFGVELAAYPKIMQRFESAMALAAFSRAQPESQADCVR